MRKLICFLSLILCSSALYSQLVIENTLTPEELVEEVLLGEGVTVSNIEYTGDPVLQIGEFNSENANVGIPYGIIMSSGDIQNAIGPNEDMSVSTSVGTPGDDDLSAIADITTNDASVLEFDFVPTGDTVKFNYVFGSDEYMQYANGSINDAFAFILSGVSVTLDPVNIAVLPGTNIPVTLNNVNETVNPEYYIDNGDDDDFVNGIPEPFASDPFYIEYDGMTVVLTAKHPVQCGETYHIKIVIADGSDSILDSGVFLEGGSFTSELISLDLDLGAVGVNDSTVYEGCGQNNFVFTRPEGNSSATAVDLTITGSAENGVDYEELPDQIFFPEDVYSVEVPFTTFEDALDEGVESLTITFETQLECTGASIESTYTFYIQDPEPLEVESPPLNTDCGIEVSLEPEVSGGFGLYNIEWESGSVGWPLDTVFYESTTLNYTATDTCGMEPVDGVLEVILPDYPPMTVDLGPDQQLDCLEDLVVDPAVEGGSETYDYVWINSSGDTLTLASILDMQGIDVGPGTLTLNVFDECLSQASDEIEISFPPVPVNVDLGPDLTVTCLDTSLITPNVSGGIGDYSYEWFEEGISISTDEQIEVNTGETVEISLFVEDQCGNSNQDDMSVIIPPEPIELITHNDTVICHGDSIELFAFATGGQGGYSYEWSPVNEQNVTEIEERLWETTTYSIYAEDVCGNATEAEILVQVEEVIANFNYDKVGSWGLEFTNASNYEGDYLWDFDDGTTSTEENPSHTYYDLEPHTITLYVTTENMCTDSASITYYPDAGIYIPDAFTPNGDGINDYFKVEGHDVEEFEIWIYNRWGSLVYHSQNIDEVWEGEHKGGEYYVEDEIYSYRIKATGIAGNEIEKTGNILIIR
ncbi:choice-of-anchor L domain-containing protein [Halocola ammonii]